LTTPDDRFVWIRLFVDSNILMKSLASIVILFQVLAWTTASSTPDILGKHNVTEPPYLLPYIIDAAGGDDTFSAELEQILQHASSLHHARRATFDDFMSGGASGIIKRLCFDDGECWATKISINNQAFADLVKSGIDSMQAIEKYCPDIPMPRVRGYSNGSTTEALRYYFMDWIDGKTLESEYIESKREIMENGVPTGKFELNVTLPENFGRQFASFIYNLTTCPIPEEKSTFPNRVKLLIASSVRTGIYRIPNARVHPNRIITSKFMGKNIILSNAFTYPHHRRHVHWIRQVVSPHLD
jgi:hypothetical protein